MTRWPNSGLSATRASAGWSSSRPSSSGAMLIARRAWLARKAGQPSTSSGRSFSRASSSSRTSRRPGDSAQNSTRPGNSSMNRRSAASGSAALASIARFGSGRAGKRSRPTPGSTSSWLATTRGQFFSRAKQSSTGGTLPPAAAMAVPDRPGGPRSGCVRHSRTAPRPVRCRAGEHLGVLRQVVEEGRGFLEEQRQVVLDSRGCQTAGEVLVDRAAPVVDVEALAEAAAETGDRFLVQGNSRAGSRRIDSTLSMERWVSGSKVRRVSISSSNRSIRKGNSLPIGNRSISAPRTANSPCS